MVFFMVFFACSTAVDIDTMKGKERKIESVMVSAALSITCLSKASGGFQPLNLRYLVLKSAPKCAVHSHADLSFYCDVVLLCYNIT